MSCFNSEATTHSAIVIVPFASLEDAKRWAATTLMPESGPIVITAGAERSWADVARGLGGAELEFDGGWRAKYAAAGTVIIARCDDPIE